MGGNAWTCWRISSWAAATLNMTGILASACQKLEDRVAATRSEAERSAWNRMRFHRAPLRVAATLIEHLHPDIAVAYELLGAVPAAVHLQCDAPLIRQP